VATNEPVLGAKVEVESGPLKTVARFHSDHGDYAVDDAAFVQALSRPGEHALVFTVAAAGENDLLDGTLRVEAAEAPHDHEDLLTPRRAAAGAGALLLVSAAVVVVLRRRRAQGRLQ
jgi:ferric-dicitrate binding protein FerR (iron transport regulator)